MRRVRIVSSQTALRAREESALEERAPGRRVLFGRDVFTFEEVRRELAAAAVARWGGARRAVTELERLLLLRGAAADAAAVGGGLGDMPLSARLRFLDALAARLSALAVAPESLDAVFDHAAVGPVFHDLWRAYLAYRHRLRAARAVDRLDENRLILRLVRDATVPLPGALGGLESGSTAPAELVLSDVRWLDPFRERLVLALAERWGPAVAVGIESFLPQEHAERWQGPRIYSGSGRFWRGAPRGIRSPVVQGLLDAWGAIDPAIGREGQESGAARIEFSTSVGVYGEVEDLARRVAFAIDEEGIDPQRIALVFRDLGPYFEAVADVFRRFNIPLHFRRGLPAAAVPIVKLCLDMLRLPGRGLRRTELELVLASPWLAVGSWRERAELRGELRRRGVRALAAEWGRMRAMGGGRAAALETWGRELTARMGGDQARPIARWARDVAALVERWLPLSPHWSELVAEAAARAEVAHALAAGAMARARLLAILDELARAGGAEAAVAADEFIELLAALLADASVPLHAEEGGVRVLTPYDIAGLELDLVVIGGLDSGVFPQPYPADAIGSPALVERLAARLSAIEPRSGMPSAIWPDPDVHGIQERLLFFAAACATRGSLVLSCQRAGEDGQERVPSLYFEQAWQLAGWPAWERLEERILSPYERWRLARLERLHGFWARQKAIPAEVRHRRQPFPGESGPVTRPLAVCRAPDEVLQERVRLAARQGAELVVGLGAPASDVPRRIAIERERDRFFRFDAGLPDRMPGPFCGGFTSIEPELLEPWLRQRLWSPAALASLLNCRFQFLCRYGLGLAELRGNEDLPDPAHEGQVWHAVMARYHHLLRGDAGSPGAADAGLLAEEWRRLARAVRARRAWLVPLPDGEWRLDRAEAPPVRGARPVALPPGDREQAISLAEQVFAIVCREIEGGDACLGDPSYWAIEKERGWAGIERLIEWELAPAESGLRRCVADIEWRFGAEPEAPPVVLELPAGAGERTDALRLTGAIDRVDVLLDARERVAGVEVWDYKGRSRLAAGPRDLVEGTETQMPVYWIAARARWGARLLRRAGYLFYELRVANPARALLAAQAGDCDWAAKRPAPGADAAEAGKLPEPPLTLFARRVRQALELAQRGDFRVSPLDCGFCEFAGACRIVQAAIPAAAEGGAEGA